LTEIHKKTVVPYTADEMYALVNDIEAYPDFLPWCTNAQVLNTNNYHLTASVAMEIGKIKQTFTTENTMQPGLSIQMKLVKGPFKQLYGHWQFEPDGTQSSTISLDMDFEFKNKLLKLALNSTFNKIMGSLVTSFVKRAQVVYGKR